MITRDPDLGRREGIFIPIEDVQAHEACGWKLIDTLNGDPVADVVVLMQPPRLEYEVRT